MALIVAGFVLGGAQTALAGPSVGGEPTEADPYCELQRNGASKDYDGIGWSTGPDDGSQGAIAPDTQVGPAQVTVCEGEHWDGQDSGNSGAYNSGSCTGAGTNGVALNQCGDPNSHDEVDTGAPLGVRATTVNSDGSVAVYLAVRISGVGQSVIFQGVCTGGSTEHGHASDQDCQGDTAAAATGIYLVDNTPFQLNVLAAAVSAARLTKGYVHEGDCTQAEYEQSAYESNKGNEPTCGRDNTAISAEILL